MENFQFRLLTYRFEAQIFLREVAPDVLTIVPWCGSLQDMFVSHTVPRHNCGTSRNLFFVTPMTLHTRHLSHTPGLKHATPQLRLRPGRPVFATTDFEHSDV